MYQNHDDMDPHTALRADLWSSMSMQDLAHQQDIALNKMSTLSRMLSPASPPQYLMLYDALHHALSTITHYMDQRSKTNVAAQPKEPNGKG